MARRANYLYEGNEPWGRAISNLGLALFGDPVIRSQLETAQSARDSAAMQRELVQAQIDEKRLGLQQKADFLASLEPAQPDQFNGAFDVPPPGSEPSATGVDMPNFDVALAGLESSGDPRARTSQPGQTASGLYGFTDPTWLAHRPPGAPEHAYLASEDQQQQALRNLTGANETIMGEELGREPTGGELGMAHRFGAQGALDLFGIPPTTPINKALE